MGLNDRVVFEQCNKTRRPIDIEAYDVLLVLFNGFTHGNIGRVGNGWMMAQAA